jgi:hypothetical protein
LGCDLQDNNREGRESGFKGLASKGLACCSTPRKLAIKGALLLLELSDLRYRFLGLARISKRFFAGTL